MSQANRADADADPRARDERLCPLCGRPNACVAAARGSFDGACWCQDVRIPDAVLARIPADRRGLACICRACATGDPG